MLTKEIKNNIYQPRLVQSKVFKEISLIFKENRKLKSKNWQIKSENKKILEETKDPARSVEIIGREKMKNNKLASSIIDTADSPIFKQTPNNMIEKHLAIMVNIKRTT